MMRRDQLTLELKCSQLPSEWTVRSYNVLYEVWWHTVSHTWTHNTEAHLTESVVRSAYVVRCMSSR